MVGLFIDILLFVSDRMRTAFLTLIGIAVMRIALPV
jgi:hypothetical protein